MDDLRGSLSEAKKRLKHRLGLAGRKRKTNGTGGNPGGEEPGSTSPFPQPEPHVAVDKDHDGEGDRANAAEEPVYSTGPPQQDGPESVSAHGVDDGQEGGEAAVDGGEASKMDSHPHPDVEVAVGSEHSGEPEGVDPSPSTPSISHGGEPDSTWTWFFWSLYLITPSDNIATSALPECGPKVVRPDETLKPSTVADEKKSQWKSSVSTTNELLRAVRDSASAFGPLISIARSLCSILDNCEVWFLPAHLIRKSYGRSSELR